MTHATTTYRLLEGRGLLIRHFGEALRLTPDTPVERSTETASIAGLADAA